MASLREVGQRLKQAREAQGLSVDEVAARTRITVRHLLALEEGNETDLPEIFYIRGFLKKYAEAVGLSPSDVADAYRSAPVPTPSTSEPASAGFGPIGYYMAIALLLGGVLALAWHFQPRVSVVEEAPSAAPSVAGAPGATPSPATTAVAVAPPSPAASPSSPAPSILASPPPSPASSPAAAVAPATPESPSAAVSPAGSPAASPPASPDPAASVSPAIAASPAAPASPAASPTTAVSPSPRPGTLTVSLVLVERSWVEVLVDRRRVFEGLLSRGSSRKFTGREIEVSAGNSGGVRVYVNGEDRGILGRHGVVMTRTYRP